MGRSGQHLKWWMPIVGRFAANALLLWTKFVPTRVHIIDPRFNYLNEPFVVSAWHEALLIPALKLRQFKFQVLASLSRDGEWTKQIVEPLGLETIRGSSSRGGAQAVLEILKSKERRKLAVAITPDGPRGPRRVLKPGVLHIASKAGVALIPVGVAYDRPKRFQSWDRFAFPIIFRKALMVIGQPIMLPEVTDENEQQLLAKVQQAMDSATLLAEENVCNPKFKTISIKQALDPNVRLTDHFPIPAEQSEMPSSSDGPVQDSRTAA